MRTIVSILMGAISAVVAIKLGFNITQWEYWGIFALVFIPYVVGVVVGLQDKKS